MSPTAAAELTIEQKLAVARAPLPSITVIGSTAMWGGGNPFAFHDAQGRRPAYSAHYDPDTDSYRKSDT